jgi:hypothetical protein
MPISRDHPLRKLFRELEESPRAHQSPREMFGAVRDWNRLTDLGVAQFVTSLQGWIILGDWQTLPCQRSSVSAFTFASPSVETRASTN